jgi:uncharacterized protein YndB with AHSA1/START domain
MTIDNGGKVMIEVTHQISAVRRQIGSRVLEAGSARVLTISQSYATTPEDLWGACSEPDRIARWFMPVTGDLTVGGRYQIQGNAGGTIERCDPPKSFAATWEFGGEISWIEVSLIPEADDSTTLKLVHIAHVDDERWAEFGPGAVGIGWDLVFMGLATHLSEGGAAIDPQEAASWPASDDGKTFMTLSGDLWREASVAAGTDEASAKAAADRCLAFYTGATP